MQKVVQTDRQSVPLQRRAVRRESFAHLVVQGIVKSLQVKASCQGVSADFELNHEHQQAYFQQHLQRRHVQPLHLTKHQPLSHRSTERGWEAQAYTQGLHVRPSQISRPLKPQIRLAVARG